MEKTYYVTIVDCNGELSRIILNETQYEFFNYLSSSGLLDGNTIFVVSEASKIETFDLREA